MADERTIKLTIAADGSLAVTELNRVKASTENLGKGFDLVNFAAGKLGPVLGGIGLVKLAGDLLQAGMAAERLNNSFIAATGSIQAGSEAMAFVRAQSARLGLDLQSAADGFMKIAAASKGTALEGEKTQQVFRAISGASSALGLSADQTNGALLAISQMMSKGTVQAEELRGQLGERIPGSFQIAARAMGVTTTELGKMLQEGKVVAEDFLPKFARELEKTFPPSEKAMAGLTAETNRLKTAFFELNGAVMQNGGETVFTRLIRELRQFTEDLGGAVKAMDDNGSKFLAVLMPGVMLTGAKHLGLSDQNKPKAPLNAFERNLSAPEFNSVGPVGGASYLMGSGDNIFAQATRITGPSEADLKEYNKAHKGDKKADDRRLQADRAVYDRVFELQVEFDEREAAQTQRQADRIFELQTQHDDRMEQAGRNSRDRVFEFQVEQDEKRAQSQFDDAASLAHWAAQREQTFSESLAAEREFHALKSELSGSSLDTALVHIDSEEQAWINSWAMLATTYEEYESRKATIEDLFAKKRAQATRDEFAQKLNATGAGTTAMMNFTNALFTFSGKKSKELFMLNKAAGIANAVVNTAEAATKALAAPPGPPWSFAYVAAAVAAGMMQIATISATTFEGGGTPSGGGGASASPSSGNLVTQPVAAPAQPMQQVTIQLVNPIGERRWFEDNLPEIIRDMRSRNVDLGVTYA